MKLKPPLPYVYGNLRAHNDNIVLIYVTAMHCADYALAAKELLAIQKWHHPSNASQIPEKQKNNTLTIDCRKIISYQTTIFLHKKPLYLYIKKSLYLYIKNVFYRNIHFYGNLLFS